MFLRVKNRSVGGRRGALEGLGGLGWGMLVVEGEMDEAMISERRCRKDHHFKISAMPFSTQRLLLHPI